MLKDLTLACQAASAVKAASPMAGQAKELYQMIESQGGGGKDFGYVLQFLRGTMTK